VVALKFGYPDPAAAGNPFNTNLACFLRFEADYVLQESSGSGSATQPADWTAPITPSYPLLTTNVLNMDIDGNGSRGDTFVSGRLMKYIVNENTGVVVGRERLDDNVLLKVAGSGAGQFNGDMNGDGQADLLFCFTNAAGTPDTTLTGATASGLQINVWHGCVDDTGKLFILRNNKLLIHLRTERKNG